MTDENKVSHEDVVNAVRKALLGAANRAENEPLRFSEDTLRLAQAYERIESASVPY